MRRRFTHECAGLAGIAAGVSSKSGQIACWVLVAVVVGGYCPGAWAYPTSLTVDMPICSACNCPLLSTTFQVTGPGDYFAWEASDVKGCWVTISFDGTIALLQVGEWSTGRWWAWWPGTNGLPSEGVCAWEWYGCAGGGTSCETCDPVFIGEFCLVVVPDQLGMTMGEMTEPEIASISGETIPSSGWGSGETIEVEEPSGIRTALAALKQLVMPSCPGTDDCKWSIPYFLPGQTGCGGSDPLDVTFDWACLKYKEYDFFVGGDPNTDWYSTYTTLRQSVRVLLLLLVWWRFFAAVWGAFQRVL